MAEEGLCVIQMRPPLLTVMHLGLYFFFGGIEENGHCDLGFIFHQCEEIL